MRGELEHRFSNRGYDESRRSAGQSLAFRRLRRRLARMGDARFSFRHLPFGETARLLERLSVSLQHSRFDSLMCTSLQSTSVGKCVIALSGPYKSRQKQVLAVAFWKSTDVPLSTADIWSSSADGCESLAVYPPRETNKDEEFEMHDRRIC